MKFIGIVGSTNEHSYNRKLLEYAQFIMMDQVQIDIIDIANLPLFSVDLLESDYPKLHKISEKIISSDGVIIATPEINHTIPPMLKSLLEWLSFRLQPFKDKPVMIIGASHEGQGTIRAQMHLRQILASPGLEAFVIPGNEFLLNNAKDKFDNDGRLLDEQTIDYLEHCILRFKKFATLINTMDLNSIESHFTLTLKAGGYINLDDPNSDGTAAASEY
ncbi:MAG: NAD(P)H-dependent oxidoreductase [Tissierellia bacterium]|nr:NAD(P)H-dependent oxidoreductase [Tissierellia bacterium]